MLFRSLFFLHTLAFTQLEVAFGLFVLARFGLEARDAGKLLAFMGLVSAMLQGGLIGRLTKRFGEQNLVPAALALMVIAMFAAAFAYNQMIFTICLFGIALGMGITNPCLSSLTSKGAAPGRKGSILGVYQSAGSLARVSGPPVAGVLFDRLGPASPLLTASGLAAMATVLSFVGRKSLS